MKNGTVQRGNARSANQRAGLTMVSSPPKAASAPAAHVAQSPPPIAALESGIVVREEELGSVKAQRLYKMRCECGRSWFELELPTLVECPACKKLCLVTA
ncbi:MAG TPA: hypothetical protein VN757_09990 [Steroidobacteraceae bacterium]|nr:hypothetical protein [Steroidobacteraceae bacterium]